MVIEQRAGKLAEHGTEERCGQAGEHAAVELCGEGGGKFALRRGMRRSHVERAKPAVVRERESDEAHGILPRDPGDFCVRISQGDAAERAVDGQQPAEVAAVGGEHVAEPQIDNADAERLRFVGGCLPFAADGGAKARGGIGR